jgi:fructosamine-3-kinase
LVPAPYRQIADGAINLNHRRYGRSVTATHPLLGAEVKLAVQRAVSVHLGRDWSSRGFTDLNDRASHPSGIFHGQSLSVFAKLDLGGDAGEKFQAELSGLAFLREHARIATPTPIGTGLVPLDHGFLLLTVALSERPPQDRTRDDWRSIGHTLATLHQVHGTRFGLEELNGFFGALPQDNHPVTSKHWVDFYTERRIVPLLRSAVDSGRLPLDLAADVERLAQRLPLFCGPEPHPTLLHGDAQQNNFISTDAGAVAADVAPYFGHPEIDLALVDYFQPVPHHIFDAYRDMAPIDAGFAQRRDLWRIFVDLACIAVEGTPFDRYALTRLAATSRRYF